LVEDEGGYVSAFGFEEDQFEDSVEERRRKRER